MMCDFLCKKSQEGVTMNIFTTVTNSEHAKNSFKQSFVSTILGFSVFACIGFIYGWQTFLLLEIIVLMACGLTFKNQNKDTASYELSFEGSNLHIKNVTTQSSYELSDIPISAVVIKQNKYDKANNCCSFSVKNTTASFSGVENCNELRAYINDNLK